MPAHSAGNMKKEASETGGRYRSSRVAVMAGQAAEPQKPWGGCLTAEDGAELSGHRLSCKSRHVTSSKDSSERGRTVDWSSGVAQNSGSHSEKVPQTAS